PGSANAQANDFFRTAIDVCQRLRRRGVLLTKYPEQLPETLPDGIVHFDFVPFGALMPRAAGAVHHGGIGSCAQAFSAGIPQLAMPMAYDQLDNATRLKNLGVGEYLPAKKFRPDRVEPLLTRLISSTQVRDRCRELAGRCETAAPLETACELLEALLSRSIEQLPGATFDSRDFSRASADS
ncbi:MAG: nucleotide disphospho-sugar-binding domain-containing protein, partial [Planctomycetota bacterium]